MGYTQSLIPYKDQDLHIDQVLDSKAGIITQCQRMIRERLYKTKESLGQHVRDAEDERAFMIDVFDDPHENHEMKSTISNLEMNDEGEMSLLKSSQDIAQVEDSIDKVTDKRKSTLGHHERDDNLIVMEKNLMTPNSKDKRKDIDDLFISKGMS